MAVLYFGHSIWSMRGKKLGLFLSEPDDELGSEVESTVVVLVQRVCSGTKLYLPFC